MRQAEPSAYTVYGEEFSLFTQKLETALRYYAVPFQRARKTDANRAQLETGAGTHQIPVLQTPENWLIADTTPILGLLDARFPTRRLFPEGALGVLVHVVEEVLDEWVARVMVHYRWHYAENTRFVVSEILERDVPLEAARSFPLAGWGLRACRATGTEMPSQQRAAEREYLSLLAHLEAQLGETRYALGDRPCAVDTILLGGLRAHTHHDPVPDLSAFPRVLAWAGTADSWDGAGALAPFPESTAFARHVLGLARDAYQPFLLGNAKALASSLKAFVAETYGEGVSYRCRAYPQRSRAMVLDRIRHQLRSVDRTRVEEWLDQLGLSASFAPAL